MCLPHFQTEENQHKLADVFFPLAFDQSSLAFSCLSPTLKKKSALPFLAPTENIYQVICSVLCVMKTCIQRFGG